MRGHVRERTSAENPADAPGRNKRRRTARSASQAAADRDLNERQVRDRPPPRNRPADPLASPDSEDPLAPRRIRDRPPPRSLPDPLAPPDTDKDPLASRTVRDRPPPRRSGDPLSVPESSSSSSHGVNSDSGRSRSRKRSGRRGRRRDRNKPRLTPAPPNNAPPAPDTDGKTLVPIIFEGTIEKTLVPQAEYDEWASARDALWGGMDDEALAQNLCAADQMLDRNTAKRLTDMATSFLVVEGGIDREEAEERGHRYLRALDGMRNYTEHYSFAELPDLGE